MASLFHVDDLESFFELWNDTNEDPIALAHVGEKAILVLRMVRSHQACVFISQRSTAKKGISTQLQESTWNKDFKWFNVKIGSAKQDSKIWNPLQNESAQKDQMDLPIRIWNPWFQIVRPNVPILIYSTKILNLLRRNQHSWGRRNLQILN